MERCASCSVVPWTANTAVTGSSPEGLTILMADAAAPKITRLILGISAQIGYNKP